MKPKNLFREHPVLILIAAVCFLLFIVLRIWEDRSLLTVQGWNEKEVSRISVTNPEEFTFGVVGDNKGNRSFFEPILRDIEKGRDVAFVMDIGDLVDGGRKSHYRQFFKQLKENLQIPFVAAIGNHDLYRDSSNYREIFGPTYYAFNVGQGSFLVLDAATESAFDKTELLWLEEELQKAQTSKARFVFMHVPPFDPRGSGFKKCLPEKDGKALIDLFKQFNVTHLFASHIHGYFSGVWEGVAYTITGGAGGPLQGSDPEHFFHHYVKAHFNGEKLDIEVRRSDAAPILGRFFDWVRLVPLDWGLLVVAGMSLATVGLSAARRRRSTFHGS